MIIDDPNLAKFLMGEIFQRDSYELKKCLNTNYSTIVDVGANYGFFALFARVLFPKARIVCFEPNPVTYAGLVTNLANLGIETHCIALGDGTPVDLVPNRHTSDSGSCKSVASTADTATPSMRLDDLLKFANVDVTKDVMLKIDCEGAERFALDHPGSYEALQKAKRWMMEIHYSQKLWPECPDRAAFEAWWHQFEKDTPGRKIRGPFLRQYGMMISDLNS